MRKKIAAPLPDGIEGPPAPTWRLADELAEAALAVVPLACKLIRRALAAKGHYPDEDKVLDMAHDAALKAAATWEPETAKLTTWTGWYVRAVLRDNAVTRKKNIQATPFGLMMDAPGREEGESYDPEDVDAPDPSAGLLAGDRARLLAEVRKKLPPLWFAALWLTVGQGLALREAGARMGISCERVRQLKGAGLEMARRSAALRKAVAS